MGLSSSVRLDKIMQVRGIFLTTRVNRRTICIVCVVCFTLLISQCNAKWNNSSRDAIHLAVPPVGCSDSMDFFKSVLRMRTTEMDLSEILVDNLCVGRPHNIEVSLVPREVSWYIRFTPSRYSCFFYPKMPASAFPYVQLFPRLSAPWVESHTVRPFIFLVYDGMSCI